MDYGHEQTDKMLKDLEKRIQKEYSQAAREVEASMNKWLANYRKNDDKMRALWKSGEITKKEYTDWRKKQIMLSDKWKAQRDELTQRMMEADKVASKLITDHKMDVYALNYNYGTYEVEKGTRIDTGFSLYNKDTVARLMKDDPKLLPPPGKATSDKIRRGELKKWNNKQVQSVMTQGILQGESIPKISKRLAVAVGEKNAYSHYRAARTMTTSAENAGRMDSYKRAEDMGIKMGKTWLAAHDNHTRRTHRIYDGMTIPIKEEFAPNLMFPGDPDGDPAEVYNCRCTLVADVLSVDGIDLSDIGRGAWEDNWNMDYDEWVHALDKEDKPSVRRSDTGTKTVRNYDNKIAKAVGRERYDGIVDALDASPVSDTKTLFQSHIDGVGVLNHDSKGGAYCSFRSISWNAERDSVDSSMRKAFSTFYHESGHALDSMLASEKGGFFFYSTSWNNGEFSKTIKDEVGAWVDGIKADLKAGLKKHATDIDWLKEKKLLSDYSLRSLESLAVRNNCTVEDILSKKVKPAEAKYYMPKVVNQNAYNLIEDEIRAIQATEHGDWKIADISDILEGATKGNIQCGWGHGKSYWKSTDVAVEAFAEMSQAHIVGNESLEVLEKYLPNSVDAYRRMVADAVK